MIRVLLGLALIWAVLMPPFFTDGACTAEFDQVNKICRYYRDSEVRVRFQYDDRGRLRQLQADMKPFKFLSFPWLGTKLYWAK
jgi:hypothetical protein